MPDLPFSPEEVNALDPNNALRHIEGDGPCYYCGILTNNAAGNPGLWSVGLCHLDDPGVVKWHHGECVSRRLAECDELQRQIAEARTLLDRTIEIVQSAYRVPEWMQYGRTERTDDTLDMIAAREKEPHA